MSEGHSQCLYCYQALGEREHDFHSSCSKKFFGTGNPVLLPFDKNDLEDLSKEVILRSSENRYLQVKISLNIEKKAPAQANSRFIIAGLDGRFILKPPVAAYPFLPELEDLTMHLASIAQIKTSPHSLIRLQSGELAYLSKRTDRTKKGKLAQEDMCQLNGTLTEDKYQGSMEKIGKLIHTYSSNPGLDAISFFELTLFCFLTGNAHMHLKSFSLLRSEENDIGLAPAYDLVATQLLFPDNKEEMALSVNGKKKNLKRSDFDSLAGKLKINSKTLENTYKRFQKNIPGMLAFIEHSILPKEMQQSYQNLIKQKARLVLEQQEEVSIANPQEVMLTEENEGKPSKQEFTNLINVTTGEIIEKKPEDPRQLSLFPV